MSNNLTPEQVAAWSIDEYFKNLSVMMKFKDDFLVRRKLIRAGRDDLIARRWDVREMRQAVDWCVRTHVTDPLVLDVCEVLAVADINPYYFFPNGCNDAPAMVKELGKIVGQDGPYTVQRDTLIALLRCKGPTDRPAFERLRETLTEKLSTKWDCVGIITND